MTEELPKYKDTSFSFEERVEDLVSRMTLEEKASQMVNKSFAIKRLGIPRYNWWSECLHGVATFRKATIYPEPTGIGATFNNELLFEVATAISDEARALFQKPSIMGKGRILSGLTYWSPNINLFRDPRWGRGEETYGEDPYLMGRMGVAFVKGLQGDHPKYLKIVSTPKHFAVHSGPEKERHRIDIKISKKEMYESYLPHFRDCVKEAGAYSIMGAYNRVNGEPCCGSITLLEKILRQEWGFKGYVVSDCGAIGDFFTGHKVVETGAEAAAMALKAGCDLFCRITFPLITKKMKRFHWIINAVEQGLISEEIVDKSVKRLLLARFKLGMFDPPEMVPYTSISKKILGCEKHKNLTIQMAREAIVLLKNENKILPLDKNISSIAVIGPNSKAKKTMLGNYTFRSFKKVTPLEGIKKTVSGSTKVYFSKGCDLDKGSEKDVRKAIEVAEKSEIVVMVLGISQKFEGEEAQGLNKSDDDRQFLGLPPIQQELLEKIHSLGKPIVLVILNGSPISIPWAHENIPAIVEAWYPGEKGGVAIADVLFGDYSPAGRMPITVVKSEEDLAPIEDYNMKGRTYRYLEKEPLYPFGYGLSYTKFDYYNLKLSSKQVEAGKELEVKVNVKNIGDRESNEVIQLYLKDIEASVAVPKYSLQGFKRINLKPGEDKTVSLTLKPRQMAVIDEDGKRVLEPGQFKVFVGGCQPDDLSQKLSGVKVLEETFEVIGKNLELEY